MGSENEHFDRRLCPGQQWGVKALSGGNLFTKQRKDIRQTAICCFSWRPLNLLGQAVVCDNALYLGGTGMDKHAFSLTTRPDDICNDICDDIGGDINADISYDF